MRAKLGQWEQGRFTAGPTFTGRESWIHRQAVKLEKATGTAVTVVPLEG